MNKEGVDAYLEPFGMSQCSKRPETWLHIKSIWIRCLVNACRKNIIQSSYDNHRIRMRIQLQVPV